MARLNQAFNANDVNPEEVFEAIPAGDYMALITESYIKTNQKGTGENLNLTLDIIDGHYKGRKLFDRVTLSNSTSLQAEEIGQRRVSAICHATGVLQLEETSQLHNIPMMVKVGMRKQDEAQLAQYGEQNDIKGYKALQGAAPAATHTRPAASAAPRAQAPARTLPTAPRATPPRAPVTQPQAAAPANKPSWVRK